MKITRSSIILAILMLLALPITEASAKNSSKNVSRKCSAAIKKAGADHAHCLLDAEARHDRTGNDEALQAKTLKCDSKFDRAFNRALRRYPNADCNSIARKDLINETSSHVFRFANASENAENPPLLGGNLGDIDPYEETDCVGDYCQATTSNYSGFVQWPGTTPPYFYTSTELKALGFSAVATPFAIQLKKHSGSRSDYINAVIADAAGDHQGDGMCFQLKDGTLLMPQEFCGGDGWPLTRPSSAKSWPPVEWDVQNFCPGIVTAYSGGEQGLINMCENPDPNCEAVCTLVNLTDGKPNWLDLGVTSNMQSFIDHGSCMPHTQADSFPYSLPTPTGTGSYAPCETYGNWCTGRNMHFDGLPLGNSVVDFKVVHCDINGPQQVGVKGTPVPPPPSSTPKANQLVIKYTGTNAASSCEPPYPYSGAPTSVPNGTPTPIVGSETSDSVNCYGPTVTFTRTEGAWTSSSSSSECTAFAGVSGAYTCTLTE